MTRSPFQTLMDIRQDTSKPRFTVHIKGGRRLLCRGVVRYSGLNESAYVTVLNAADKQVGIEMCNVEKVEVHTD